ncbi:MAG: hypothetical protein EGQ64_04805 [Ruminococcaceae bacterium]|nr:hypothetical protein [Oscillospiraceae bacterium]
MNRAAFSLLYESLFVVSSHFRAEPLLCESFTASEDGKTYRYTLVSGVSFSDGTPLTAQDAAASLEAALEAADSATEEAGRSRLRTTVYQVWVAQSSTWGAASQPTPRITSTSTAMPMPFFSFISRL